MGIGTLKSGPPYSNNSILTRPVSSNGLPGGNVNANGVGTLVTPLDYYIEALAGEKLRIARMIIHVVDAGTFDSGSYGNGIVVTNGIQLYHKRNGVTYDITALFPIKTNVDWARYCFDDVVSAFGLGNESLSARWSFDRYGTDHGITLNTGDRIGIRLRDDLSGLVEHTFIMEGVHLATPNAAWDILL